MSADGQPVQGSAAARLDDNHRVAAAAAAVLTVTADDTDKTAAWSIPGSARVDVRPRPGSLRAPGRSPPRRPSVREVSRSGC